MRHLRSIVYALVLAPAVWVLCAVGVTGDRAGAATIAAGVAYAILLLTPISPAGPVLAGLSLLGLSSWAIVAPTGYEDFFERLGWIGELDGPGYALAALLAVPLLCTALNARRWERHQPPRLLFVGTVGRTRQVTLPRWTPPPDDVISTQVIPTAAGAADAEPTQVISAERTRPLPRPDEETRPIHRPRPEPAPPVTKDLVLVKSLADDPTKIIVAPKPARVFAAGGESTVILTPEEVAEARGLTAPAKPRPLEDDSEKTQVIRLPTGAAMDSEGDTRDFAGGGKTYLDGPGERTQVIFRIEGLTPEEAAAQVAETAAADQAARDEAAQEKARQAFRDRAAIERAREAFSDRAAAEAREVGSATQKIRRTTAIGETTRQLGLIPKVRRPEPDAGEVEHTGGGVTRSKKPS